MSVAVRRRTAAGLRTPGAKGEAANEPKENDNNAQRKTQ